MIEPMASCDFEVSNRPDVRVDIAKEGPHSLVSLSDEPGERSDSLSRHISTSGSTDDSTLGQSSSLPRIRKVVLIPSVSGPKAS